MSLSRLNVSQVGDTVSFVPFNDPKTGKKIAKKIERAADGGDSAAEASGRGASDITRGEPAPSIPARAADGADAQLTSSTLDKVRDR